MSTGMHCSAGVSSSRPLIKVLRLQPDAAPGPCRPPGDAANFECIQHKAAGSHGPDEVAQDIHERPQPAQLRQS
jgi:hypothetical protein